MNGRPDIAVIPAAGRGLRLKSVGLECPKGFLRIGELPIVEESLLRLLAAGISRIVIVTGHLAEHYAELATRYPNTIKLVHNPAFAATGSMHSLAVAQQSIEGDFLLLDSDLVYEQRALTEVLAHPAPDVLLVSPPSGSGDEVYVEADDRRLHKMSKQVSQLGGEILGEMVGISKVSCLCYKEMIAYARNKCGQAIQLEYEAALVGAAGNVPIHCHLAPELLWSEIDNEDHFKRASESIYPAIMRREGGLKFGSKQ
jgi:2-aminoethylphosphonate-pyruvate transaminase